MVDQQKAETIAKKQRRDKKRNRLLLKDDRYYDNETSTNPDQKNGLNPLKNDWN